MSNLEDLFGLSWRQALVGVLQEFLDVFKDIRDTQKDRLATEKDMLTQLQRLAQRPPVRGIVKLGPPVDQ